jgi:hypothetical protein
MSSISSSEKENIAKFLEYLFLGEGMIGSSKVS